MKSKKVLITAVVTVVVLTIALFAIVFSMQHAMAQKGAPVEDVPTEAVTEEPAETTESEIPEKTAKTEETEELPAELPEEAEAQPDELSEETCFRAKKGLPENAAFAIRFLSSDPVVITNKNHRESYRAETVG